MPTTAQYEKIVYDTLRAATPVNPGLPDRLAKLATAQTMHETATEIGNVLIPYTSPVFKDDNNLMGYKWVNSRYQIGKGRKSPEGDYYGKYATIQDSAKELVDWIYRRQAQGVFPALNTIQTPEQYAALLKKAGFYTDNYETYSNRLKAWFGKIVDNIGSSGAGMVFGVVGISLIVWGIARSRKKTKKPVYYRKR